MALGARRSALGARRSALGARRSALGARRSALGARRSALGARRSALGARRSALGARRSALGARRSALGAPNCHESDSFQPPRTNRSHRRTAPGSRPVTWAASMARRQWERIISAFQAVANTVVWNARTNEIISMITICFLLNTPSIHPCGRDTALSRHRAGRRLEKGIFVQSGRMYLSKPHPTRPGARTREFPAAPRLPALLRIRRPAEELRPCRRGARRHPARRRPPYPHAGKASRRRPLRAGPPERAPQPQGKGLLRGGPAHPSGHPGDHRAPCRRQALPGALENAFPPLRLGARTCLPSADVG